jgi:hypothetical protein
MHNWLQGLRLTFLGRYENLSEDWKAMCRDTNLPWTPLDKNNYSFKRKQDYRTYYHDGKLREQVTRYYEKDLQYYGYEF